jgi:hypothetical protein
MIQTICFTKLRRTNEINCKHNFRRADFEIPGVDNRELARWIRDNLEVDQGILEFYKDGEPSSGWIHCSYSRNSNRQQWLRAARVDGKTHYTPWIQ